VWTPPDAPIRSDDPSEVADMADALPTDPAEREAHLRERLSPLQYEVTQHAGTERAFTGVYWDTKDEGVYRCIVCETPLFSSATKYDSGSGWPSFWEAIDDGAVDTRTDSSHGMVRTEALCATCGAHLGHVFPDGPAPTGQRYCMNSASLRLVRPDGSDTEPVEG
jgi:peptide-methionine (R)-S-oxide reductase